MPGLTREGNFFVNWELRMMPMSKSLTFGQPENPYAWYNCTINTILNKIAAIAQTTDRVLTLFTLHQPTMINNSANGGNTPNSDSIADVSSFLFFVIMLSPGSYTAI